MIQFIDKTIRRVSGFGKGAACVLSLACLFLLCPVSNAQLSSASVQGTVKDPSGAVIPGAQVTLHDVLKNTTRSTTTNDAGSYVFVDIDPGTYTLQVNKPGFSGAQQNAVNLAVDEVATFNFTLSVGTRVQKVTVSAAQSQLQTATSNLGTVFETKRVNDLPLNGRNFTQLLDLTPGASPVISGQAGIQEIQTGNVSFPSINGQENRSNLFLMDGVFNMQTSFSGYAVEPIIDAIQEFQVQSHNDQSQFGGVLGGIINVVTKSGTSHYHGDAWDFLRNDALDAKNPLLGTKTPLKQNVYGVTIGGPVIVPFYNGRKHLFFFGAYEGTDSHSAAEGLYDVPTAAELNGDFSAVPEQIYNPFSTQPDPAHPGQYLRTPFHNNQIPTSLFDPHMVAFAKLLFPAPVSPEVEGFNGVDTTPSVLNQNNYSLRLDDHINDSNLLWGRFSQLHLADTASGGIAGQLSTSDNDAQNWAVNYVHTFGSAATLQLQAGHSWQFLGQLTNYNKFSSSVLNATGYNNGFGCNFLGPLPCQLPGVNISGYLSSGGGYGESTGGDIYQYSAYFSKLLGNHLLQAGTDLASSSFQTLNALSSISYSAFNTSNLESTAKTGDALASFLLGVPSSTNRRDLYKRFGGSWIDSFYVQDQWKVSPKLTVNLGLREDLLLQPESETTPTGSQDTGAYDFSNGTYLITKSASKLAPCSQLGKAPCLPGSGSLPAHVVVASSNRLLANQFNNIQPRIGLAYSVTPKTVLHASYGRVYDTWSGMIQSAQNMGGLWPSVSIASGNNLNNPIPLPTQTAENPLGNQINPIPAATPFQTVAFFVSPHIKDPESDQWMAGVQRQLGNNNVITINYVGSRSTRLFCCGYYNTALTPGPGNPQSRALYPYIVATHYQQSVESSNYNALQAQVQHRFSNGVAYTLNYTWSKTIDVACDDYISTCFSRDPYHPNLDRSVAGFDLPQIFTANALYELPFGTGRKFQTGNRFTDALIGGWQINGIVTLESGRPYIISYNGDVANTGNIYQGAQLVGNPHIANPTVGEWFNTAAFAKPPQYTFGNVPRNFLRSQSYKDVDLSVFRNFTIERITTQFRVEAFNAFNQVVYGVPNGTVNSTTFGVIRSTASTQREVQLALKINF